MIIDNELSGKLGKVFFVGIGGISMSGLAEILLKSGISVAGSDKQKTPITENLSEKGATLYYDHNAKNITDDITLVVYTAAVKKDNPELVAATEKNIPTMYRTKFLGLLMKGYKYNILVSGSHGKTGTTALVSNVLINGGYDPTVSIGGIVPQIGSNVRVGSGNYFVAEACEYCDSFLEFFPYVAIILNIEMDHEDYFKDLQQIRNSFAAFAKKTDTKGVVVINGDIKNYWEIVDDISCQIRTYGIGDKEYDFTADNIALDDNGCASFDIIFQKKKLSRVNLKTQGEHHILNTLAVFAALDYLGIAPNVIADGIDDFKGVVRRFEKKGTYNGALIIDDYAHHPTEIEANIIAAKKGKIRELYCVFQPHTYSRTKALLNEFVRSLSLADHIIVTDIYASREKDPGDIHSKDIIKRLSDMGRDAVYIKDFDDIVNYLKKEVSNKDMVITMGAGDIFKVGDMIVPK